MQLTSALPPSPDRGRLSSHTARKRTTSWQGVPFNSNKTLDSPITRKRGVTKTSPCITRRQLHSENTHSNGNISKMAGQQENYHSPSPLFMNDLGSPHSPSSSDSPFHTPKEIRLQFQKSKIVSPSGGKSLLAKCLSPQSPSSPSSPEPLAFSLSSDAIDTRKTRGRSQTAPPPLIKSSESSPCLGTQSTRLSREVKLQHAVSRLKEAARAQREEERKKAAAEKDAQVHSIMEWLFDLTGERVTMFMKLNGFRGCFPMSLKSGKMLCQLANQIQPNIIRKINYIPIPRLSKDNIEAYLTACRTLGVAEEDLFAVEDLYTEKCLDKVLNNLFVMKRLYETAA